MVQCTLYPDSLLVRKQSGYDCNQMNRTPQLKRLTAGSKMHCHFTSFLTRHVCFDDFNDSVPVTLDLRPGVVHYQKIVYTTWKIFKDADTMTHHLDTEN